MLMLTTSASRSLKRSNSASYEGNCAEQTLLKAKGTKASTTFFLPRKSLSRQSSRLAVFRVKSGAMSPTLRVLLSARGIAFHPSYISMDCFPWRYWQNKSLVLQRGRQDLHANEQITRKLAIRDSSTSHQMVSNLIVRGREGKPAALPLIVKRNVCYENRYLPERMSSRALPPGQQ